MMALFELVNLSDDVTIHPNIKAKVDQDGNDDSMELEYTFMLFQLSLKSIYI